MQQLNAAWQHRRAVINNIQTHYVEQGAGTPVAFCHGFPGLWFGWHRQITALAEAGYRVLAPDMRGMGQTEAPSAPEAYGVDAITADLVGLLDHCAIEQAIFARHRLRCLRDPGLGLAPPGAGSRPSSAWRTPPHPTTRISRR